MTYDGDYDGEVITFGYGLGFAGAWYYMMVFGKVINLGMDKKKAGEIATKILWDNLEVNIHPDDIDWKWNGTL